MPEKSPESAHSWENPNSIKAISKNREVIRALATFLQCQQKDVMEALSLRASENVKIKGPTGNETQYVRGYHQFHVLKSDGKNFREINDPAPALKQTQRNLLNKLRQIPFSIAVTGGEPMTGIRKNVEPHVRNRYTLTLDLKDAFPSTSADRIHANIRGYLERQLDLSFPQLSSEERSAFKQAVVALLVKDDKMPQGAPTSTHLLNLVLAKTDSDILRLLHSDSPGLHLPAYTRYVDDLTISFRSFEAFIDPWRIIKKTGEQVRGVLGEIKEGGAANQDHEIQKSLDGVKKTIEKLVSEPIRIHHEAERHEFRKQVAGARQALVDLKRRSVALSCSDSFKTLDGLIGTLDRSVKLDFLDGIAQVRESVESIVRANGWTVNHAKTKEWTPISSTTREITGVTIGHDGKLGIPGKAMETYVTLARQCAEAPETLPKQFKSSENGQPDPHAIAQVLQGVRAFIVQIKDQPPKAFQAPYEKARNRFFEGWRMAKPLHPVRFGEGY